MRSMGKLQIEEIWNLVLDIKQKAFLRMAAIVGVALVSGGRVKSFLETTGNGENQEKQQTDEGETEFILEYNNPLTILSYAKKI